ncbi:MAG: hypothetical protein M3O88_03025 [Actinomycetota bacterium]|nr:hypothetical protein [Actinomycetota bacterium]
MDALKNQYFTEDIIWHTPGRGPIAGTYRGPDEVIGSFAKSFELTNGTLNVEDSRLPGERRPRRRPRGPPRGTGRQEARGQVHACRPLPDGKVAASWLQQEDLYAVDEFFS